MWAPQKHEPSVSRIKGQVRILSPDYLFLRTLDCSISCNQRWGERLITTGRELPSEEMAGLR